MAHVGCGLPRQLRAKSKVTHRKVAAHPQSDLEAVRFQFDFVGAGPLEAFMDHELNNEKRTPDHNHLITVSDARPSMPIGR